jgi:uncharacterized protein (TIGR02145 family)
MKQVFLLAGLIFTFVANAANTATEDDGVEINGVVWATRNVDAPGTFTTKPESAGMFYQWNKITAWSATVPGQNIPITGWKKEYSMTEFEWEIENDPSPTGWHIPSLEEINKLLDKDKVDDECINIGGVNGRKFTDKSTKKYIILPIPGWRTDYDGNLTGVNIFGHYWGSTLRHTSFGIYVDDLSLTMDCTEESSSTYSFHSAGRSIRCVKDNNSPSGINDTLSQTKTAVAYYNLQGVKLDNAPARGLYIVLWDNGTAEKVIKK